MTTRRSNRDLQQEPTTTKKITLAIGIPVERYMSTRAFLLWKEEKEER